jgi:CheY-like chemotaxis protein/HPt (histidine-containing phosphotransfer) domain-containing protein
MLQELGWDVEVASNGRQALDALADPARRDQFALVLMDSQMPQLDGYRTTEEIRRREAGSGRHIPIVAMTASAMQGDRERCLAAGMNDYLAKPVSFEQLAAMLRQWLPAPESGPGPGSGGGADGPGVPLDHGWLRQVGQRLGPSDQGELTQELLEIFRGEAPARLESLRDAARQGDPGALERAAHSLHGNAKLLGATEVVELSARIERLGRAGTTQGIDALLPPLQAAMARVCALEAAAVLGAKP